MRRVLGGIFVLTLLPACGSGGTKPTATTAARPTTTAAPLIEYPPTQLTVAGVSPGVEQPPFYPQVAVDAVTCGVAPGGRFVALVVPPGASGTPRGSALSVATTVVVGPGRAALKDHNGRALYTELKPQIQPAAGHGSIVLSLNNAAARDADGRVVENGAVNVVGDYLCPATDAPFPGF